MEEEARWERIARDLNNGLCPMCKRPWMTAEQARYGTDEL